MENQVITWVQIFQVGGLAGVISAGVSAGVKELLERRERQRKARYLALRLSLIFERYFHECRDWVYDVQTHISSGGHAGTNHVGLPELPNYPDDAATWIYLDKNIVDEVLSFPVTIKAIDEGIWFNVNQEFEPDGPDPEITLEPLYEMAFRSIDLARRVRAKHWLHDTIRTRESEIQLKERQMSFLEKLNKRRDQHRESFLDI